ncbi:ribonuclease H-like protein [Auricularia subglabra TFB-10046 SS5]|nr:ribonuclease H-like protein [Auricularia subglabra TFB-10046 SS5]
MVPGFVVVRNYVFCARHGKESCMVCFADNRVQNNYWVRKYVRKYRDRDLAALAMERLEWTRRGGLDLHALGRPTDQVHDEERVYQCLQHSAEDCSVCFDFTRRLLEGANCYRDLSIPDNVDSDASDGDSDEEFDSEGEHQETPTPDSTVLDDEHDVPPPPPPGAQSFQVAVPHTLSGNPEGNPLLRLGYSPVPKSMRPVAGRPGVQRPSNPKVVLEMISQNCPRRFIPPSPDSRPADVFYERRDFSMCAFPRLFHRQDDHTILAYTDGACLDQDGGASGRRRAGCAFVYCDSQPGQKLPLEGTIGGPEQTSNRAELRAVLLFLQMRVWESGGADRIVVATDSEYVVEGACTRLDTWVRRNWRTASGTPVKNKDLWEALLNEIEAGEQADLNILFWRIPRAWNQRADGLAKEAADMPGRSNILMMRTAVLI